MENRFVVIAVAILSWPIARNARVIPQPGQNKPVSVRKGHSGRLGSRLTRSMPNTCSAIPASSMTNSMPAKAVFKTWWGDRSLVFVLYTELVNLVLMDDIGGNGKAEECK